MADKNVSVISKSLNMAIAVRLWSIVATVHTMSLTHSHRLEYVLLAIGYTGLVLELLIGLVTLIVFQR